MQIFECCIKEINKKDKFKIKFRLYPSWKNFDLNSFDKKLEEKYNRLFNKFKERKEND